MLFGKFRERLASKEEEARRLSQLINASERDSKIGTVFYDIRCMLDELEEQVLRVVAK